MEMTMMVTKAPQDTTMTSALLLALDAWGAALEQGMRFDDAMRDYVVLVDDPLSRAMSVAMIEIDSGRQRRAVLRQLARRVTDRQVTTVVQNLLDADLEGRSILDTVRAEAARLRANGA